MPTPIVSGTASSAARRPAPSEEVSATAPTPTSSRLTSVTVRTVIIGWAGSCTSSIAVPVVNRW